ncbi:MAG: PAS domain S-box protein [Deltaproteobacteria bacterium]|nr:PAS domain S-box protein [Deltaproteobacteria bacterium]
MSKISPPFTSMLAHHAADPFRLLVESVVDYAIYMVDPAGVISSWNPGAERLYGYRGEDIIGRHYTTVVSPEELMSEKAAELWRAAQAAGHVEFEGDRVRKDGAAFRAIVTVSVLKDHFGNHAGFSVVTRDITERKQAEEAIRRERDLSDAILSSLPGVFYMYDEDRRFLRWNWRLEMVTGYSAAEIQALDPLDVIAPTDRLRVAEEIQAVFADGQSEVEADLFTKDGRRIPYLFNGTRAALGGLRCLLGMGIDIRSLETARAELRRTMSLLEGVVEGSPDGLYVKDRRGTYLLCNSAAARFVGKAVEDMLGKDDTALFEPESARVVMASDKLVMDEGQSVTTEERLSAAGATRVYEAIKVPYRPGGGEVTGVIGISRDITARKQAEEALRQQQVLVRIAGRVAKLGGWSLDLAAQTVTWSDEICAIHELPAGYQPTLDEAIRFYAPEYREHVARVVSECATEGTPFEFELELTTAKGRRLWVRAIGEAVRDGAGRVASVHGAFQDITERKQAEVLQRQLGERLITTLETMTDGFVTLDRDWRFTYVNAEAERITGRSRGELLKLTMWQAFPETMGLAFEREYRRALAEGITVDFEEYFPPLGGWFGVRAYPSDDGLAVSFRDVTTARDAKLALAASEARLGFLNEVSEAMRKVSVAGETMTVVARLLGEFLRVSRCAYASVEADGETFSILRDYTDRCASLVGQFAVASFGPEACSELALGRVLVVRDVGAEVTSPDGLATWRAAGVGAFVLCPVVKDGALRAMVVVHHASRRDWRPEEVSIVQEVAERSWSAIERQTTREKLRQSESLFRTVVQSSWDVFHLVTPDGRIAYESPAVTKVLGYEPDEMVGRHIHEFVHPDDVLVLAMDSTGTQSALGVHRTILLRVRHKDGSWRWVESYEVNLVDHPDVRAVAVNYRDITERYLAEQALVQSEERFRLLSKATSHAVWEWDMVTGAHSWNDGVTSLFGYSRDDLAPTMDFCLARIHPDDRETVNTIVEKALGSGSESWMAEYRFRRKDGAYTPVLDCGYIVRNARGEPVRMLGGMKDLSDSHRIAESLRLRDRAIQQISQGIVITDPNLPDNPIIYASPGAERLTGYRPEELVGRNCRLLQGKDTDREVVRTLREQIEAGRACTVELLNYRKDGTQFWNEISVSPVHEGGAISYFVGVQTDVTARKEMEAQLRQSQKMEAVGRLAGGIAHDFNNLLTIISGHSELLLSTPEVGAEARESITFISDAAERAASLTRQLLGFSRQTVLQPKVLDANALVAKATSMLRRVIGEDILFTTVLAPTLHRVKVDPGQLDQVLMNLAVNARDAMPRGGRLTVETSNVVLSEEYAATHLDCHVGDHVLLAMTDSGCGMPPEVMSRIFEPFYTTKPVGKGTGLGLSMVFGIVQQSGGCIHVYSEPGRGTTFKIYLPAVQEDLSVRRATDPRVAPRGTETILLVEDDEGVRSMALMGLRMHGYNVLTATDGQDALRVARAHRGPLDLILTDVVMPNLSGPALIEQLKEELPRTKVLFMSGYTDDAVVRHGLLEANVAFIQKPYTPMKLARKVREVLDATSSDGS